MDNKLKITSLEEQFKIEELRLKEERKERKQARKENLKYKLKKLFSIKNIVYWGILGVIIIVIVSIVLPLSLISVGGMESCSSCNGKKYSLDNISISVSKKENDIKRSSYINGKTVGIYFDITNNSTEILSEINGEMKVYLCEDNCIMSWTIRLSGKIDAGQSKQTIVTCDAKSSNEMDIFYNASLRELKLTYTISYVYFGDIDLIKVEDDSLKERVIKPYREEEM